MTKQKKQTSSANIKGDNIAIAQTVRSCVYQGRYWSFFRYIFLVKLWSVLCIIPSLLTAQTQTLLLQPLDRDTTFLKEKVTYPTNLPDSQAVNETLRDVLRQLHEQSYLEASIDQVEVKDSIYSAFLHIGQSYQWVKLRAGNVEDMLLERVGYRARLYEQRPFSYAQLRKLQEELLEYTENNGYPFAQIRLDSLTVIDGQVSATLHLDKGSYISIDSLDVIGDAFIGKTYLSHYLGLRAGMPFSNEKLLRVRDRIRALPFLEGREDAKVRFVSDLAIIQLYLDRKKASKFDFIVGFLPANNRTPGQLQQRLLLTGNFEGELYNQFGAGERIYASFEQLQPERQEIALAFSYPYLLDLPFGIDTRFELYRRDATFLDANYDLGIQYLLEGGNYLKVFINNATSNLLRVDTTALLRSLQLPEQLDIQRSAFGVEYALQRTDYQLNPRRGWQTYLRASAGIKRIRPNNAILELSNDLVDFAAQYDSLSLRSFQYRIDVTATLFIPFFKRTTLKISNTTGLILAATPVLLNEQFRLGGNQLLRGFNEEAIQAEQFSMMTLEYRLLIAQNSYLYLFGDSAYVNNPRSSVQVVDFPYGFGGGLTFETPVGLFGMSLAWGAQLGNAVDFNTPKIHFGYVSRF
ncbi:MAG: BamA/TamA family outer membrane protein [Bacteroidota bacterium]